MKTVFILTYNGSAIGVYATKNKATTTINCRINEEIEWYVKHITRRGAAFAEQNLKGSYKVVEMEVQE